MAKITLSAPNGPYRAEIDTEVMDVEISEAFIGVSFITLEGKKIGISQRDGNFEIMYTGEPPSLISRS